MSRILLFLLVFFHTVFASAPQTCGLTKECPDGLACIGAIGTSNNGICVMTGPQIVLCKTVNYFDNKLASVFAIFAVVMIGIAFFLGKISWGMIVSVIIGIGLIKGSTSIIKKITNENDGYCSSTVFEYSALSSQNNSSCFQGIASKLNTNKIYNQSASYSGSDICKEPLSCYKKKCSGSVSGTQYMIINGNHTGSVFSNNYETFIPEAVTGIKVTNCNATQYAQRGQQNATQCTEVDASCSDYTVTSFRDYFYCRNTCINTTFIDNYAGGTYKTCAEVASANAK